MPSNRQFRASMKKKGKKLRDKASQIVRYIILDLDQSIVLSSPVLTGRFRGNWFPTLGVPSTETDYSVEDEEGAIAINRLHGAAATYKLGTDFWFANNLPYGNRLEHGYSGKAPNGMVAINVNRIKAKYG